MPPGSSGCIRPASTSSTSWGRLVGDLTLAYERLELPADRGLAIVTYTAEPGSPSEERLRELREWSSTRSRLAVVEAHEAHLT